MVYTPNDLFEKYFLDEVKRKNYIWDTMLASRPFSEEQIERLLPYAKENDWKDICRFQILSEKFMRKYIEYLDWNEIIVRQKLTEDFMRENEDKIDWEKASTFQRMSMNFMIEFADRLDWLSISFHQEYNRDFVKQFKDKMHNCYMLKVND